MKKLLCVFALTCASPALAADYTATLRVPPGFVQHWVAPRPFTTVVPGTPDVVEVLRGSGRELVFMVKPEGGTTNILLLNDDGEQIANLLVTNPSTATQVAKLRQGPEGWQVYRKDVDCELPCVRPKEKK
jgi:hypothetical protein